MTQRKWKILSQAEIINHIASGKAIVIYQHHVLNLTKWIVKHPGGDTAVYHLIGRDATDEMNAYHSDETISTFLRWKIGEIDHKWKNLLPPIQGGVYDRISLEKIENNEIDSNSSSSTLNELEEFQGIGKPKGKVVPSVAQNKLVTKENVHDLFPIEETVIDPKVIISNYDNDLTHKDINSIPSLDYITQQHLRDEYNELHKLIIKNGFYKCNYWAYVREIIKISCLVLFSFSFLKIGYLFLSAFCIGCAWHQATFIAHDAGHVSITHNYQFDNIFGILIADWFGGLSLTWWKRNHNVHHLITNDPVHDPDIQHLPFFAVSVKLFQSVYSTYYGKYLHFDKAAQLLIPLQHYMYYPILCFGRFNLYRLSWAHLINGDGPRHGKAAWFRYFELLGMSFFFYWFFYLLVYKHIEGGWNRFNYIMVSHITTMLVHVQITLSHFAMSTSDLGVSESFVSRQLRTTMDVDCPEWLDFFHGGLQFQAIHHLFPRLPRHNFRRVQPLVISFCNKVGLKYSIYGFGQGNSIVIGKLGDVAKQCSILLDAIKQYDGELT